MAALGVFDLGDYGGTLAISHPSVGLACPTGFFSAPIIAILGIGSLKWTPNASRIVSHQSRW